MEAVIANNLVRLRGLRGISQGELAARLQAVGLAWTEQTVRAVEKGRRRLVVAELFVLAGALSIGIAELLRAEGSVNLEGVEVTQANWAALISGRRGTAATPERINQLADTVRRAEARRDADHLQRFRLRPEDQWKVYAAGLRPAEARAARALQVSVLEVAAAAIALWGHGLTDERDEREKRLRAGGVGRRGQITRQLVRELRSWLDERTSRRRRRAK